MKILKNKTNFLLNNINLSKKNTPENWSIFKFSDFCDIVRGGSPRPIKNYITDDSGIPWLKIRDATSVHKYIEKTEEFILEEGVKNSRLVEVGDFIVSNSATPGIPRIMKIQACIHDGWLLLKNIKNELINKDFLFYKFFEIKNELVNKGQGSIFINLSSDILKNFEISFPDLKQQEKIASALSLQERQIEIIEELIEKLETRNQYYAEKLLSGEKRIRKNEQGEIEFYDNTEWQEVSLNGKDVSIPVGWEIETIGNKIIEFKKSKIKAGEAKKNSEGIYPFFNCSKKQTLTYDDYIVDDDVLFLNTGGIPGIHYYIGKSSYSTDSWALKSADNLINKYLYYYIFTNIKYLNSFFQGAVIKHLNKREFKKFEIFYPKVDFQKDIISYMDKLSKEKEVLEELLIKEKLRFQWMLDNLLSGEYQIVD